VRVEDVSVPAAELFLRTLLNGFQLSPRQPDSRPKTPSLSFQLCVRNVRAINVVRALLETQHTTNHYPFRDTEAVATQLVRRANKPFAIDLLSFVKVAREETGKRIERFLLIDAVGNNLQVCATTRSKRQNAQYRFRICFCVAV